MAVMSRQTDVHSYTHCQPIPTLIPDALKQSKSVIASEQDTVQQGTLLASSRAPSVTTPCKRSDSHASPGGNFRPKEKDWGSSDLFSRVRSTPADSAALQIHGPAAIGMKSLSPRCRKASTETHCFQPPINHNTNEHSLCMNVHTANVNLKCAQGEDLP